MMCAEQAVEKREVDREILVDRDLLYRMMPVVEARRRDDAAEMVEIAAQIGVEQRGVDIDEADIGLHHRWREAEGEQRQRSEEHTSELQSLMRNSYAVFCLKKKNKK